MYSCQFISFVANGSFIIAVRTPQFYLRKNNQMACLLLNTNTTGCKISSSHIYYQLTYLQIYINSEPLETVT
jgi:hypothetical protein